MMGNKPVKYAGPIAELRRMLMEKQAEITRRMMPPGDGYADDQEAKFRDLTTAAYLAFKMEFLTVLGSTEERFAADGETLDEPLLIVECLLGVMARTEAARIIAED